MILLRILIGTLFITVSPAPIRTASLPQPTPEPQPPIKLEELSSKPEEQSKNDSINDGDGEEIADDLSEISDEADDILNRQEVNIPFQ